MFLSREPAPAHRHARGGERARRHRSPRRPRPRRVPESLPLGRERQLGAAAGRHGVRATPSRTVAGDRRLWPPLGRRASRCRDARDPRVPPHAGRGLVLGARRFEGHHLSTVTLVVGTLEVGTLVVGGRQELDAPRHDLDRIAALAVLLPRPALQTPVEGDAAALGEVLRAELALAIPGRDPDEVGSAVAAAPIDREEEARDLLLLRRFPGGDFPELDVGREVADQVHAVHALDGRPVLATKGSRLSSRIPDFSQVDSWTVMGLFSSMTGFGGRDMAVDLGTANTLVYVRGRGIVLSEPSVVAIDQRSGEVHAVGVEAKRMLGRTPGTISAIRPLKDGVIADFDVTEQMLRHFIEKVHQHRFAHPRVVVCVPSGVTGVEKRAVEEATLSAGARQAYLIEEPMAAAIGAGLPVAEPTGNMIVDIGGGTSEVAVISLGGIVVSQSLRVGGDEMDEAIVNHVKREYKLLVGQQTAEEIKLEIGSAYDMREELQAEVRGRDMLTGLPKTVVLTSEEVRRALDGPVGQIIDAIKSTLDKTPHELAADIMDRGIVLAGGGALLNGLDERLRHETQMPVHLAESPLTCVAVGSGRSLEEFEAIHRSQTNKRRSNHRP